MQARWEYSMHGWSFVFSKDTTSEVFPFLAAAWWGHFILFVDYSAINPFIAKCIENFDH